MKNVRRLYGAGPANRLRQRGAAAVEFALVASILFTLLFASLLQNQITPTKPNPKVV